MRALDNPFRSDRQLGLRYRLTEAEWRSLLVRLGALGRRAALVGPQGSGKTTLLRDLGARLEISGFAVTRIQLNEANPGIPQRVWLELAWGPRAFVLLDGAERLGRLGWLAFSIATRRANGVVITTHEPRRLPTLAECSTSPELLADLVEELLCSRPDWLDATCRDLFAKHNGNMRDALRELYDRFASTRGYPRMHTNHHEYSEIS
jgi:hypothetical protein